MPYEEGDDLAPATIYDHHAAARGDVEPPGRPQPGVVHRGAHPCPRAPGTGQQRTRTRTRPRPHHTTNRNEYKCVRVGGWHCVIQWCQREGAGGWCSDLAGSLTGWYGYGRGRTCGMKARARARVGGHVQARLGILKVQHWN